MINDANAHLQFLHGKVLKKDLISYKITCTITTWHFQDLRCRFILLAKISHQIKDTRKKKFNLQKKPMTIFLLSMNEVNIKY
jgi:hypothetical protein